MMQGNVSKKKVRLLNIWGFNVGGEVLVVHIFFWAWIYFVYMYLSSLSMNKMELLDTAGMAIDEI